jgi:hypothetical protein
MDGVVSHSLGGPGCAASFAPEVSRTMDVSHVNVAAAPRPGLDGDSQAWLRRLRVAGPQRDAAIHELRDLLVRAARFEVSRRRAMLPHLRGDDWEDLAEQSADDALLAILSKLDDYRGDVQMWKERFGK